MSYVVIDDFASPWSADVSGLWRAKSISTNASGFGGPAMLLAADAVGDGAAFVERSLPTPLDLSAEAELRFWIRCSHIAADPIERPFFLRFTVRSDPADAEPAWFRLVPVGVADRWELVRLWLEDMPDDLRPAVGSIRFESYQSAPAFAASFFQLLACRPSAIADVEQSLLERFQDRFTVPGPSGPETVAATVSSGPSHPASSVPCVVITPVSIDEIVERDRTGTTDVDNYTTDGAHVRAIRNSVRLAYAIDTVAGDRAQGAEALSLVVADLLERPIQLVANSRVAVEPFEPAPEVRSVFLSAGRSPFFVRFVTPIDAVERSFHPWALPSVEVGPGTPPRDSSEPVPV